MAWSTFLLVPVSVIYFLVVLVLYIFGINFLYLSFSSWKSRRPLPVSPSDPMEAWPSVTVQLPIYNEWYVVVRLIEAAAALEYPPELLEIQVLDDSTDETRSLAADTVERLRSSGKTNVVLLHRSDRRGFKAGALADGLAQAHGEFMAIFDADFIPPPDFLRKTLPHFDDDRVAFVQARWGHLNRAYSLITSLQALSIDAHFGVEQSARSRLGHWFNFNGTAGVWRRSAIIDAGGWRAATLTEDLDLSYRAFLRGWEARYAGEVEVPAELPISFAAYRRQQHRWARGSLECAVQHLPEIWRSSIPLGHKVQASLHLLGYGIHLLLFILCLLYPLMLAMSVQYPELLRLYGIAVFFNGTALAPTIMFAVGQGNLGRRWPAALPSIFLMTVLGTGMMLNTLRAGLQIALGERVGFERTPKYGGKGSHRPLDLSRYHVRLDRLVFFEMALALLNFWTMWMALRSNNWMILFFAGIFAGGLTFTSLTTVFQALQEGRQAARA